VRAARTMSSTRAAWKPRSPNTRIPASSNRRIVLRPCARNSRVRAGAPGTPSSLRRRRPRSPFRGDVYASLMVSEVRHDDRSSPAAATESPSPTTLAETIVAAANRFGERNAYVTEGGWFVTYADIDRISDEVAGGFAKRGVGIGDVVALVLPPGPEYMLAY